MKHVVITGSTRGIGFGLAKGFLDLDCSVSISGREQDSVEQATNKLSAQYPRDHILGIACDVRDPEQIQALWDASVDQFGRVDIWINNAGYSGPQLPAWEFPAQEVQQIIETNLLGEIYGSTIAIRGMISQGYGALYNMEGMGSDGRIHSGLTFYGTSNAGRHYFNQSLFTEAENKPIIIGSLHPGMVITDLITEQYEHRPEDWERDKRIFNILADRVETVAPWMAAQILANEKTGVRIKWSSSLKIMLRFVTSPFSKRNIFEDTKDHP